MDNRVIEYEQPTSVPVPKVAAVAKAGAIVASVVTILALTGVTVPDNVVQAAQDAIAASQIIVSAVTAIILFITGYIKKDAKPVEAVKVIQSDHETLKG